MGIWKAMNIRMKKGSNNQEKRRAKLGVCFVEKRSTQKVMEEHRMKKGVKSRQSSADGDCGVPILADEHQMGGGVRSAEFNIWATIRTEVCQWEMRSSYA